MINNKKWIIFSSYLNFVEVYKKKIKNLKYSQILSKSVRVELIFLLTFSNRISVSD